MHELLVIVGGEVETAVLAIFEMLQQCVRKLYRKLQIGTAPACLQQLDQTIEQESMIIQICWEARATFFVRGQQAPLTPAVRANEVDRSTSDVRKIGARQSSCGDGHTADRQSVPGG